MAATGSGAYAEVIGDPIAQSKSPAIHGFWLDKLGIDARYQATRVTPDGLAEFIAARRADPDWRGCNVTMPHQQAVIALLDRLDPLAARQASITPSISRISPMPPTLPLTTERNASTW